MTYLCSLCQSTVDEFRRTCWFKLAPETITPVTIWFSPYDSRQCALGLLKLALEKAVEWDLPLRPLACTSTVVASCSGRSLVRRTLYLRKHRPVAHMTFPSHSRFAQSVCVYFLQALKKHTLKHYRCAQHLSSAQAHEQYHPRGKERHEEACAAQEARRRRPSCNTCRIDFHIVYSSIGFVVFLFRELCWVSMAFCISFSSIGFQVCH